MAYRKIIWTVIAKETLKNILTFYIRRNGNATCSKKLNKQNKEHGILFVKTPKYWSTN